MEEDVNYSFDGNQSIRLITNSGRSLSGNDSRKWLDIHLSDSPIGSGKAEVMLETLADYAYNNLQVGDMSPSFYLASVVDEPYIVTDLPLNRLLGALKGIGAISESEMLDAYKSLDLGKDNKFLNQSSSPTRGSWVSSLF